jgi:hypothetical protein
LDNVLFVGLNYHSYTQAIASEIEDVYDCNVDYIDIQPRGFFSNVVRIFAPKLFVLLLSKYHKYYFKRSSKVRYDCVLFLQTHQVSDVNLAFLKSIQPQAKYILYNWDSLKTHDYLEQSQYFDRVFTFDPEDAENNDFEYLPLFCSREIQEMSQSNSKDIYMIGNIVNPLRLDAVNAFQRFCTLNHLEFKTHLRASLLVVVRLFIKGYSLGNIELFDASSKKIRSFYESSSVVFDWANHSQSGLTMRAAEALGAGKILITNCKYLEASKYAQPGQVILIDEKFDFSGVTRFIDSGFTCFEPNKDLYIQNFIITLFKD